MAIDARDVVKAGIRERKGCLQRLANLDELIMLAMAGDQAGLDRLAIHTGFVVVTRHRMVVLSSARRRLPIGRQGGQILRPQRSAH